MPEFYDDKDRPVRAQVAEGHLRVELADGRELIVPVNLYPQLVTATSEQLAAVTLSTSGIHWDELDVDLSVEEMIQDAKNTGTDVRARLTPKGCVLVELFRLGYFADELDDFDMWWNGLTDKQRRPFERKWAEGESA